MPQLSGYTLRHSFSVDFSNDGGAPASVDTPQALVDVLLYSGDAGRDDDDYNDGEDGDGVPALVPAPQYRILLPGGRSFLSSAVRRLHADNLVSYVSCRAILCGRSIFPRCCLFFV